MGARVKRRLRKKKHLGEFAELGFEVVARFVPGTSAEAMAAFFQATEDVSHIGPNGSGICACMGGGAHGAFGYVTYCHRGHILGSKRHSTCDSATEEHRRFITNFLDGRKEIARFVVGPLRDKYHGVWEELELP